MTRRRDDRYVRNGRSRVDCRRLIGNDDRRCIRNRHDFAALDAFGRAFLRRACKHGEEQRREQRMNEQRDKEACRQPLGIPAVAGIALELHARL